VTAMSGGGPQRGRAPRSIGLWGAPQSGKTTFLAALYVAVTRSAMDLNLFGVDDKSTDFMIDSTRTLTNDHIFPAATQTDSAYSWTMNMSTQEPVRDRGRFGRATTSTATVRSQFNIDLRDAPGGWFASHLKAGQVPAQQGGGRLNLGGGTSTAVTWRSASPSSITRMSTDLPGSAATGRTTRRTPTCSRMCTTMTRRISSVSFAAGHRPARPTCSAAHWVNSLNRAGSGSSSPPPSASTSDSRAVSATTTRRTARTGTGQPRSEDRSIPSIRSSRSCGSVDASR
jgi:hypothetical protein